MTTTQSMGLLATVAVLGIVGCGRDSGAEEATLSSGGTPGAGGSSGGSMYPGGPCNSDCTETPTPLGLTEPSLLGFAPDDLLAVAEGSHEAVLTDRPADDAAPTGAPTTLTLTIERTGSATFIEQFPVRQPDCGSCTSWVEVDVLVTLSTDDGTLDEQLPAVLTGSPAWVTLTVPGADETAVSQTTLGAVFAPGIFAGGISWDADAAGTLRYADWGYACDGYPRVDEAAAPAVSIDGIVAVLNDSSPVGVAWEDGTETEMTLSASSTDAVLCLNGADDYRVAGSVLEAATTDGRLTLTLPVDLQALFRDGALHGLTVRHSGEELPIDTFTSTYGTQGMGFGDAISARLTLLLNYPGSGVGSGIYIEGHVTPSEWQQLMAGEIDVTYSSP